jgi:hypothetical protein
MMFLIRVAFWLCVVILLLPSGKTEQVAAGPQIGAADALSAASATFADMRQFCSRQPEACTVGSQAAVAFGQKAQASVKYVYDFLTEKLAHEPAATAAASGGTETLAAKPSQNTLTPTDRGPAFRGPASRPEQVARNAS